MARHAIVFLAVAGLLIAQDSQAGKYNRKLSVGDAAPAWPALPGVDGHTHTLADLKDKDVVVIVITSNSCPVAQAYEDRIIEFAKKRAAPDSKVALVAINVNNLEEDRLPKMKERAKAKSYSFPYLYDESQKIGRVYGATVTPEFFVLNKERRVVYMGAMDDNMVPSEVKTQYLLPAVEAALKGMAPATSETHGFGCSIQYERTGG